MSVAPPVPAGTASPAIPAAYPVVRWAVLIALLAGEVLFLTLRFDTETLDGNGQWWAAVVGEAHFAPQLALTVAVALAAFGGGWGRIDRAALAGAADRDHPWRRAAAGHLVGFWAFAEITRRLLDETGGADARWFFLWVFAGGLVLVLWGLAALPAAVWGRLARGSGTVLAAAVGVAGLAFAGGRLAERLWAPMADTTLVVVRAGLELVFPVVVHRPGERVIGTPDFTVHIAPSCSGYEGLGLVAAFLGLYLWLRRDDLRFPAALLLLPAGLAAAWAGNVARIAALIGVGAAGWPDVARGGFHSQAGWLAFNAVALGTVALSRRLPWVSRAAAAPGDRAPANPAAPYLWPLLAVVGTAMATGALAVGGFDALYPARVLAAGAAVWVFRRAYAGLGWGWSWAAVGTGVGVFAVWMAFDAYTASPAEPSPIAAGLAGLPVGWRAVWLVGRVLGAVLAVPLAEELAFRGYLLRRLQGADFDRVPAARWSWAAALVSSAVFGLLHPGRAVEGTLAGLGYAWVYSRRGRLADAVVAHAVTNALIAAHVLATGDWRLW